MLIYSYAHTNSFMHSLKNKKKKKCYPDLCVVPVGYLSIVYALPVSVHSESQEQLTQHSLHTLDTLTAFLWLQPLQ